MRLKLVAVALSGAAFAMPAMAQDMMQFFDANGDGKVTLEEYKAAMEQGWGFISGGEEKIKPAEANDMAKGAITGLTPDKDGYITKAIFVDAAPARFKAADKNGDGTLSAEELTASMAPPPGAAAPVAGGGQ